MAKNEIVNLPELVDRVTVQVNRGVRVTKREVDLTVRALVDQITLALQEGESVNLPGFGIFERRHRPEREMHVPGRPGERMTVVAQNVVKFRPLTGLKRAVNR